MPLRLPYLRSPQGSGSKAVSTTKPVTARAGVWLMTASHVLNGTRRVSGSALERVEPLPPTPRRSRTGLRLDP